MDRRWWCWRTWVKIMILWRKRRQKWRGHGLDKWEGISWMETWLGWWHVLATGNYSTAITEYRWCVAEMCTWNLKNCVNQCHPNNLKNKGGEGNHDSKKFNIELTHIYEMPTRSQTLVLERWETESLLSCSLQTQRGVTNAAQRGQCGASEILPPGMYHHLGSNKLL